MWNFYRVDIAYCSSIELVINSYMVLNHITYLNKIKRFIKQRHVHFVLFNIPNKDTHGYCIYNVSSPSHAIVILDPRKEFILTLIHECLHGVYPEYKEVKIKSLERAIIKKSSTRSIISLLSYFCKHAKFITPPAHLDEIS